MNESGIKPLGKRVLVQRQAVEESVTAGGIVLPQTHGTNTYKAEVIELGPDVSDRLAVGDVILHTQFRGDEVESDQGKYLLLEEDDVLATIERR